LLMSTALAFLGFANQVIQISYSWSLSSLKFRPIYRFLNEEGVISITGEFLNAYGNKCTPIDGFYSRLPTS